MLNVVFRLWKSVTWVVLLGCVAAGAEHGMAQVVPQTALDRQLARVDFAVTGVGEFTKSVRGTNYLGITFTEKPSNTLGALVTVRYTVKPLIGFEVNYGYVRYTEKFTNYNPVPLDPANPTGLLNGGDGYLQGQGAQTNANEYTVGYAVHGPRLLGYRSFASGGVGAMEFTPTTYGGQSLPQQVRALYYYDVGLEGNVLGSSHFGLRAQLRQQFFTAPDFGQNYLTIRKTTFTTEPGIGFFVRF